MTPETRSYRQRFIRLSMATVGAVLLVMLLAVGVYMYHDYYTELENTMSAVAQPLDYFRMGRDRDEFILFGDDRTEFDEDDWMNFDEEAGEDEDDERPPRPEDPRREGLLRREEDKDIVTVFYENGRVSILGDNELFDDNVVRRAVEEIASLSEDFGTLREYGMIYYRSGSADSGRITLASTAYIRQSMYRLALTLALIYLAAMLLFYALTRRISRLAVRPMEQAVVRERQFVSDVSHDLKTPLTVILANGSILREHREESVESQMRWLDSTDEAAHSMQQLVGEMLTLSRVDAADTAPAMERVCVSDLVERAVLQMESVAFEAGVELLSELESELFVSGSADYLQRIASSLMENAMKYESAGGQVRVTLTERRGQVLLRVHNRSSVIAPEDLPHVFERFYRSDKARSAAGGHGLGLAIAKGMAERMGGTLSVESAQGQGTTFTLSLDSVK